MASFTDQRPASFNPYIQQLPVDTMVAVGIQQQAKYNEGVQRVQTYLNSLSGIDVVREADRKYIQQRLSDMTSQVNKVASADWSNQALTNQVGAMAAHIANDENVQSAIIGTKKVRDLQGAYKTLREKTPEKYSAVNEAYDMEAVNEYLVNPNPGEPYRGPTTPWLGKAEDIRKRLNEQVETIKKNPNKRTIISPIRDKDGNPTIMYQLEDKTWVSDDDLKSTLSKQLTAEDLETLHRDSWFNLRTFSNQELMGRYLDSTDYEINNRNKQIKDRWVQNAVLRDPDLKEQDTKDIRALEDYTKQLLDQRNKYTVAAAAGQLKPNDISQIRDGMWNKAFIDGIASTGVINQSNVRLHVDENAKFALEKNFQKDLADQKFMQDLAIKLSDKHPEVLSADANGKIKIDFSKVSAALAGASGTGSYLMPLTQDINNPDVLRTVNDDTIATDVLHGATIVNNAKQKVYSYFRTLPQFQGKFKEDGTPINAEATAELDKGISVISRYLQEQARGVITNIPFMPKNPTEAKEIKDAVLQAQIGNLYVQGARDLEATASREANIRARIPADFGTQRNTFQTNSGPKAYTTDEILNLASKFVAENPGSDLTSLKRSWSVPVASAQYGGASAELSDLLNGPDGERVREMMTTNEQYISYKEREKGKVYEELSAVNTPLAATIALPEKKTDPTFVALQRFLQSSLGNKAESESITPLQTVQQGGKKYVIAQYKPADKDEAKQGLVTEAIDVTSGMVFSPGTWLSQQFNTDKMPELTRAIERNPKKQTPLDSSNNFADALFTTGESPHFYQITKAKENDFGRTPGAYYITVAVPSQGGQSYSYESSQTAFGTAADAVKFINSIFATKQSAEEYYKTLKSR